MSNYPGGIVTSSTAPASPDIDDLWIDKTQLLVKRWNGTAWVDWTNVVPPARLLAAGGETALDRHLINTNALTMTSQFLRMTCFTAERTETITQVRVLTGTVAAAATPTLCRIGVWTVNSDGSLTLVASTANDTTLFAAINTPYTRTLSSSLSKVRGQQYALGALVVTAAAAPTMPGLSESLSGATNTAEFMQLPYTALGIASQSDLPASISQATAIANGSNSNIYGALVP